MGENILLVTSSFEGVSKNLLAKTNEEMHYPLGLAYLHSYLKSKNHKVKSLFLNHLPLLDCIKEMLQREAIKWVKSTEPYKYNGQYEGVSYNAELWIKHFFNITEEELKKESEVGEDNSPNANPDYTKPFHNIMDTTKKESEVGE